MLAGSLYETYVLHTAWISNIENAPCANNEKDGKCGAMERPHTKIICDKPPACKLLVSVMSKVYMSSVLIKKKVVNVELWSGHILGDKRPAYCYDQKCRKFPMC